MADTTSVAYNLINYAFDNYSSNIILFLIVLALIILFLINFNKFLELIKKIGITNWFSKNKKIELTKTDLANHYIFTHFNYLLNVKLNLLNFGDPVRNYLVRLLIHHKIKYLKDILFEFVNSDFEKLSDKELENKWIQLMYDSMSKYIDEFKKEAHNYEEQEVVQVVIDALWAAGDQQAEYGIKGIQDVSMSGIYESNIIKVHSLLLPLMVSTEAFIIRCEKALNNLNGRLTGKHFHGQTFPEYKYKK